MSDATKNYVAIIDIGSNAVRLVVYDGPNRAPLKIHNERVVCDLGADLATTGRLNPESVKKALSGIGRFSGLLTAMKIKNVRAVATAAIRDAKDGQDFIDAVQKKFGLAITVIGGDEEARLAAQGVLANGLGVNGIIGDYGGGSLELIVVEEGRVRHKASLPLGSHRLHAEANRAARLKLVDQHLDSVEFLKDYAGRDFYAMGGAWRSMATAHIHMTDHPLKLLDHYEIKGRAAREFADLISRQSEASLKKMVGVSKKRLKDMNVAALTMERVFDRIRPRRLIFSGTGLREGLIYDQLKSSTRKKDALISSSAKIALKVSRFDDLKAFKTLTNWIMPLFAERDAGVQRLVEAACLLSDGGWFDHEDYQADHAFRNIFVAPLYGVSHADRAFLALSQYVRYRGYLRRDARIRDMAEVTAAAQKLLDKDMTDLAVIAGLAMRVGYLLTAGALGLLKHTELKLTPKQLILKLRGDTDTLNAAIVGDALKALAEALNREAVIG